MTHTVNEETGKENYLYRTAQRVGVYKEPKVSKARGKYKKSRRYGRDSDDEEEEHVGEDSDDEYDNEARQEMLMMKKYTDKKTGLVNLDLIYPYVPQEGEVLESVWV